MKVGKGVPLTFFLIFMLLGNFVVACGSFEINGKLIYICNDRDILLQYMGTDDYYQVACVKTGEKNNGQCEPNVEQVVYRCDLYEKKIDGSIGSYLSPFEAYYSCEVNGGGNTSCPYGFLLCAELMELWYFIFDVIGFLFTIFLFVFLFYKLPT